jgi:hypothetical protein
VNAGTENRKKTIIAGALCAVGLICAYSIYNSLFGGATPTAPPPPPIITSSGPAVKTTTAVSGPNAATGPVSGAVATQGLGAMPGVAAVKLASTSGALDPTLDETAMLRTESLVYSGTGRNIFSATYTPPPPPIPKNVPSARPVAVNTGPPPPPPPPPTCPPTCPPINLKFFGTEKHENGRMQAFFLSGDDVYLASEGDIVARKYKIVSISPNSARVEDLQNNNTQALPLQSN